MGMKGLVRVQKPPIISHTGYVMVFVGRGHHLAGPTGYAYEHRVVAEEKLGRKLLPGEIVHHCDRVKTNNTPKNLEVDPSRWHHNARHRKLDIGRRSPDQPNHFVACACGCGELILRFSRYHTKVRFKPGHRARLQPKLYRFPKPRPGQHNRNKAKCPAGHRFSPENTRIYRGKRKCRTCHRLSEASRRKGMV